MEEKKLICLDTRIKEVEKARLCRASKMMWRARATVTKHCTENSVVPRFPRQVTAPRSATTALTFQDSVVRRFLRQATVLTTAPTFQDSIAHRTSARSTVTKPWKKVKSLTLTFAKLLLFLNRLNTLRYTKTFHLFKFQEFSTLNFSQKKKVVANCWSVCWFLL